MATYSIKRELPLDDSYDVIVVGGGPSGCTAAAAAAREGARTLLIEATGCLGGMGTLGLVPAWMTFSDQLKIIVRGLANRVFLACKEGMAHVPNDYHGGSIDAERLKRIYDDLVAEAGATVLFNTVLSAVEVGDDGTVDAIITGNKAGLRAYRAKVYVDCTGDGDLAAWAGATFLKGEDSTGDLQPATLCFTLSNVDTYAFLYGPRMHPIIAKQILDSGNYPRVADMHVCSNLLGPDTVGFNAGHLWDIDNTDPESVSAAMAEGRKIAEEFQRALAAEHPRAFANAHLVNTAPLMGIRETRRIMGDYVLTIEDYMARRGFADEIARNSYPIDIHTAKHEVEQSRAGGLNVMERFERFKPGESHGIPYRCLTPAGLTNVLVAGRSISCDRPVQGAVRIMSVCLGTGEAAGLAAALAAGRDANVHAVDAVHLCRRLIEEGGYLPDSAANLEGIDNTPNDHSAGSSNPMSHMAARSRWE